VTGGCGGLRAPEPSAFGCGGSESDMLRIIRAIGPAVYAVAMATLAF
jgi:hypothetical protein